MHSLWHQCSENCKFNILRRRIVCRQSGLQHICDPKVCLRQCDDGFTVCTWSGLVHSGLGSHIDRTLSGNLPRSAGDGHADNGSHWGRLATGYAPTRARNSLRTNRTADTENGSTCKQVTTAGLLARSRHTSTKKTCVQNKLKSHASTENAKERKPAQKLAVGVQARLNVKNVALNGVYNTKDSRNSSQARFMLYTLMIDDPLRQKLRKSVRIKRAKMWKSSIRKRSLSKRPYDSYVSCLAEYAAVCEEVTLPVLMATHCHTQPKRSTESPVCTSPPEPQACSDRLEVHTTKVDLQEQIIRECVHFVMCAWSKLCQTTIWQKQLPDFQSFVMGLLYTCREGGIAIGGVDILPKVALFATHIPETNCLTQICEMQGIKDCRSAAFGRARITDGMNAIRSTLLYEQDSGSTSVHSFACDVPELLTRSYVLPGSDSPWWEQNLPIWH